jgi:hypothetical protein
MQNVSRLSSLFTLLTLAGCTSMPTGPAVLVLPGTNKPFEQFRGDDLTCRQFAEQQLGGATTSSVAAVSGVTSAIVGTLLGAAAGAAADGSHGAGVGAGAGLALGGLVGTGTAQNSAYSLQQRYDFGYQQCMYAKGHRIPTAARFTTESSLSSYPPAPPRAPLW